MILSNKAIDLIEIDAASHTGVDNIRQLKEAINIPPTNFKYKVYIIDEVHMLSLGAFNALLKTLEEPPAHAIFILATTELHKVPDTIISRCQQFNVKPLTIHEIINRLEQIAQKENIKIDKETLALIATEAGGGMRDAESLFGQIISMGEEEITAKNVQQTLGIAPKDILLKLITAVSSNDMLSAINIINELQNDGTNIIFFSRQLLNYCRNLMLVIISENPDEKLLKNLTTDELTVLKKNASTFNLPNLITLISLLQNSLTNSNQSDIPQLPLEIALIEYSLKTQQFSTTVKQSQINQKVSPQASHSIITHQKKTKPTITTEKLASKKKSTKNLNTLLSQKKSTTPNNPTTSINNSAISINNFLDKWAEVLEGVKEKSLSIAGVLKNCAPISINQEVVLIKVNHTFGKDRLNNPQSKLTIEKVFANIFKVRLKAKFLTEDELPQNVIAKDSADSKDNDKDNNNQKSTTDDNELLYEAMKKIGGKIIKRSN
jgi:DNA polymerase-3 subunit gamma/tau